MSHFTRVRTTLRDAQVLAVGGHPAGDFGFARGADGTFEAVMDSMDRARNGPGWLPSLTRAYGHAAALRYAQDHGYEVITDEEERDGTRRLTLRRQA
jgi:hypothetical protein